MTVKTQPGAQASTVAAAQLSTPAPIQLPVHLPQPEMVRHLLFGSPDAVKLSIQDLHRRRYAEPNDWSRLLPTGRPNEVMAILTRRVRLE
ncbi:MAG: hypothetical protein AAFZ80_12175 [Cyanobacteria bacterium P01_A01_bin.105]